METDYSNSNEIVRLSHVCINSADLKATENFYCGIIGAKIIHEFSNEQRNRYGFILSLGNGTFIEVFQRPADWSQSTGTPTIRHICIQVGNIKAVADRMQTMGHEVRISVGRTDGVPQFWVCDPDGVQIEFHQYSNQNSPQYDFAR